LHKARSLPSPHAQLKSAVTRARALAAVQTRRDDGGDRLARALLVQLQEHREDDWVDWAISGKGLACNAL
jgi:hypothetical protein